MKHSSTVSYGLLMAFLASATAFQPAIHAPPRSTALFGATGGWGIGNSRDMVPEEFAKGDRRAFEGYKLTDRGEFMRKVKQEKDEMKQGEVDELMSVARMAGITVKNPAERLNKFDADLFEDDEDDLDLSVPEEDLYSERRKDESITRLDDDTGALGVW